MSGIQTSNITTAADQNLVLDPNGAGEVILQNNAGAGETPISVDNSGVVKKLDVDELADAGATDGGDVLMLQRGSLLLKIDADAVGGAGQALPNPSDVSAAPPFESGSGTLTDPWYITPTVVNEPGGSAESAQNITVANQKPGSILNFQVLDGSGRFSKEAVICSASGSAAFRLNYNDSPESKLGALYEGSIQMGNVYFRWDVTQIKNLTTFGPEGIPTASPANVSYSADAKYGTVTGTWADGSQPLIATGDVSISKGGSWQKTLSPSNGDTVLVKFDELAVNAADEGSTVQGEVSNGSGFLLFPSMIVDRTPDPFSIADLTNTPVSTAVTFSPVTLTGINAPTVLNHVTAGTTLTSPEASIDGGAWTAIPVTGATGLTVNPGDSIQVRGTTGSIQGTGYTLQLNINGITETVTATTFVGGGGGVDPVIYTPNIVTPFNGATDLNPADNGNQILLQGSSYGGANTPGAHTESDWEVYRADGITGNPTSSIISSTSTTQSSGAYESIGGWPIGPTGDTSFDPNRVNWFGDRFIFVGNDSSGNHGYISYSFNGLNWTKVLSVPTSQPLYDSAWNGSRIVVVGSNDTILYSDDQGLSWTSTASGSGFQYQAVAYGNGYFVATGETGVYSYSTDGASWTNATGAFLNAGVKAMTYGGGKFVAMANGSNVRSYFTTDPTLGWTTGSYSYGLNQYFDRMVYGNGVFVLAGTRDGGGSDLIYSEDGSSFDGVSGGTANVMASNGALAFGNGIFVVFSSDGQYGNYSSNGRDWTQVSNADEVSGGTPVYYAAAYGSDRFIVLGRSKGVTSVTGSGLPISQAVLQLPDSNQLSYFQPGDTVEGSENLAPETTEIIGRSVNSNATLGSTTSGDTLENSGYTYSQFAADPGLAKAGNYFFYTYGYSQISYSNATPGQTIRIYWAGSAINTSGDITDPGTHVPRLLTSTSPDPGELLTGAEASAWLQDFDNNRKDYFDVTLSSVNGSFTITANATAGGDGSYFYIYGREAFGGSLLQLETATAAGYDEFAPGDIVTQDAGLIPQTSTITSVQPAGGLVTVPIMYWRGVAYGGGTWAACGGGGSQSFMYSSTGLSWTQIAAPAGNQWAAMTYGNGTFVAVSYDGTDRVTYSTNGTTWNLTSIFGTNLQWDDVTFGNGTFVAIQYGTSGPVIGYSSDGINWSTSNDNFNDGGGDWRGITYGGGLFVACRGGGGSQRLAYSPNGSSWTRVTAPDDTSRMRSVAYGNGRFATVGFSPNVHWSDDGINWNFVSLPRSEDFYSVTFGDGKFVAVGNNIIMYSTDAINWTYVTPPEGNKWLEVTYGDGLFVAVSEDGNNRLMYSRDGATWDNSKSVLFFADSTNLENLRVGDSIQQDDGAATAVIGNIGTTSISMESPTGSWSANTGNYAIGPSLTSPSGVISELDNLNNTITFSSTDESGTRRWATNAGRILTGSGGIPTGTLVSRDLVSNQLVLSNASGWVANGSLRAIDVSRYLNIAPGYPSGDTPGTDYTLVDQSLADSSNLESYSVPGTAFDPENDYYTHVRYRSASTESDYSAWSKFSTGVTTSGFKAVAYTGNGVAQSVITDTAPDLVWTKDRDVGRNHRVFDIIRGPGVKVESDNNSSETTENSLTSFNADGFTLATAQNEASEDFVAWTWDTGSSSTVTNTDGDITSEVRAAGDGSFSIVKYTGNDINGATVGHGMGVKPDVMWIKNLTTGGEDWRCYHTSIGATQNLILNSTAQANIQTFVFNDTEPDTSVFTIGSNQVVNGSGQQYIAYCWTGTTGVSAFGTYAGSSGVQEVSVGFAPSLVIVKTINSSVGQPSGGWAMYDTARPNGLLYANDSASEFSGSEITLTDTGFSLNSADVFTNLSGNNYVYHAWA